MFLQQQAIIDKRTRPKFVQGRIGGSTDTLMESDYFVSTEPILGGQHYYLRVKQGYRIAYIAFYDRETGVRIANHWYNPSKSDFSEVATNTIEHVNPSERPETWVPSEAYVRVTVCKANVVLTDGVPSGGDTMTPADDFVDAFYLFDHVMMQPNGKGTVSPALYDMAMRLARQVNGVYELGRTATNTQAGSWYSQGNDNRYCIGVPYSAVNGQRPGSMNQMMPSMETFLSLFGNRRSLLYTETPQNGTSEYGIDWNHNTAPVSAYGRFAFGMVCNCAAATVFGVPESTDENIWSDSHLFEQQYSSLSAMLSDNAAKLQSMDVVYKQNSHVFVITNVYRLASGEVFLEIFESTANCCLRLMTPQKMYDHYTNKGGSWVFTRPKQAYYDMVGRYDFRAVAGAPTTPRERSHYVPNLDICTFVGDKATFASGDPIWINVRKSNGSTNATFDQLKVYRMVGGSRVLVETRTLSTTSAHKKTYDDGDVLWDINVSDLFYDGTLSGLFEATAYNSVTHAESAPTRFEVLHIGIANAYRVGLTIGGNTNYDLLALLKDGAQDDDGGRDGFVRALQADYTVVRNNHATYAHHIRHGHEEGKYGLALAETHLSLTTSGYCQLAVKGAYGYAFVRKSLSTLTSLLSGATTISGKALTASGAQDTHSGWITYIKEVPAEAVGKTYTIIYNDRIYLTGNHIVVAQYNSGAATANAIGTANLIAGTNQVVHRLKGNTDYETHMYDVKIAEGCKYIAIGMPLDVCQVPLVRDMVAVEELGDLVKSEDVGFDFYFGWVGNPTQSGMLKDATAASLLTYATGYHGSETTQVRKTVTAEDVAEYTRQIPFIMWRDNHQPDSGRMMSSGMVTQWDRNSFEGTSTSGNNWDTLGGKQVSIGGVSYRVACLYGIFNVNDTIEINFD